MSITPPSEAVPKIRRKHLFELLKENKRLDGRELFAYREIRFETNVVDRAQGSALVSLGNTKVLAAVKVETGRPYPDTPDEGVLTVSAELVPLASPTFEPGPPDERAIELARVVDRGIRESGTLDLESLCIIPGQEVYTVFIDIYVLDHDGNLIDASSLAAIKALCEVSQLEMKNLSTTVTFVKLGDKLLLDPSLVEEELAEARLTVGVDKYGRVCSLQKAGAGPLSPSLIREAVKIALKKAEELRAAINVG